MKTQDEKKDFVSREDRGFNLFFPRADAKKARIY